MYIKKPGRIFEVDGKLNLRSKLHSLHPFHKTTSLESRWTGILLGPAITLLDRAITELTISFVKSNV